MAYPQVDVRNAAADGPAVGSQVRAAIEATDDWVVLEAGDTLPAGVERYIEQVTASGHRAWLNIAGPVEVEPLIAAGLRALTLRGWAPAHLHAAAGRDNLRLVLALELDPGAHPPLEAIPLCAETGASLTLSWRGGPARTVPDLQAHRALLGAVLRLTHDADDAGVSLNLGDLGFAPLPEDGGSTEVVRAATVQLLRHGFPLSSVVHRATAGPAIDASCRPLGGATNLAPLLSAIGVAPPREPPPLAATGRIHLILPATSDHLQVQSTMYGLAEALERGGAQITLHDAFADLACQDQPDLRFLDTQEMADARKAADMKAFVRSWDLSEADVVLAPGLQWGAAAIRHRSRGDARVIVTDAHMMDGIQLWRRAVGRHPEGVDLQACFPGFARLYAHDGFDLRRVSWMRYPTWRRHVHPVDDPSGPIFSGGAHLRDHDTLLAAVRLLPAGGTPIELVAPGRPRGRWPARMQHLGRMPLHAFVDRIARSRFVVVPLHHSADRAAGITVIALAHATGRAVIATATAGTKDHITHGVDGWLVPAGHPQSLAEAIIRLDEDPELRARLAAGSLRAGEQSSAAAWAASITAGAPPD